MIYSRQAAKKIIEEVYNRFIGRLSNGEDCLYAKLLRDAIREVEKKL